MEEPAVGVDPRNRHFHSSDPFVTIQSLSPSLDGIETKEGRRGHRIEESNFGIEFERMENTQTADEDQERF